MYLLYKSNVFMSCDITSSVIFTVFVVLLSVTMILQLPPEGYKYYTIFIFLMMLQTTSESCWNLEQWLNRILEFLFTNNAHLSTFTAYCHYTWLKGIIQSTVNTITKTIKKSQPNYRLSSELSFGINGKELAKCKVNWSMYPMY